MLLEFCADLFACLEVGLLSEESPTEMLGLGLDMNLGGRLGVTLVSGSGRGFGAATGT